VNIEEQEEQFPKQSVAGRKPKQASRSADLRQRLTAWKQTPESMRPSLRALALDLGTSHQLLRHYLTGLEKWLYGERYRTAKKQIEEIRARARAEGRLMTQWEEQQVRAYDSVAIDAMLAPVLLDAIERIKQQSKRSPLCWQQIRTLKIFAREFPQAQELLQECSQSRLTIQKNNLPATSPGAAKSFRTVEGKVATPQDRWRRGMASKYQKLYRSDPYDASMRNLARARAKWRPPRPWRSDREAQMVRRFALQWFTCRDSSRPSGRAWARALNVSHTWVQKLARRFVEDSSEIRRLVSAGDPKATELARAQEETRQMRERGELRRKVPR